MREASAIFRSLETQPRERGTWRDRQTGLQITAAVSGVSPAFSLPGTALRVSAQGCGKLELEILSTELERWL